MSLARRPLRLLGLAVLGCAVAAPAAPASTSTPRVLPPVKETFSAAKSKRQTCSSRPLTGRGVDLVAWSAPADGLLKARMRGSSSSDWDLALFDAATNRKLDGSSAFRSNELATALLQRGQQVRVQACRLSGRQRSVPVSLEFTAMKLEAPTYKMQLVEVEVPTEWDRARLATLGLDLSDHSDGRTWHAILHSPSDAMKLTGAGFRYRVEIADVAAQDARDRASERRFALSGQRAGVPSGRTSYRTYDDYLNDLKEMVFDHPDHVRAVTLPVQSIDGRDIVGVEIARNVHRTDDGRPVYFQIGIHHAREWPAGEATIEFGLDLLQRGLAAEDRWKNVFDNARTYIVPIQNPDGFVTSRSFGTTPNDDQPTFPFTPQQGSGAAGYRRKNCRPNANEANAGIPCEMRQNADNGVDTNRNYGEKWGGPGTSSNQSSLVYHGAGPFSEPEVESVRQFLKRIQPTLLITNHTFTGLILRPPGTSDDGPAPDEEAMREIGDAMAAETDYTSQYSYQLYDTSGTTDDWLYGGLASFSFTPEIGKTNFHPSYTNDFVPEYDGRDGTDKFGRPTRLGGLREAYLIAGEAAIHPSSHSILRGTAAPGKTLRIQRDFETVTSSRPNDNGVQHPLQRLPEHRESTLTVPATGQFEWHVAPSTRPFEREPVPWILTCEEADGRVLERREVFVSRGQQLSLDLACGAPGGPAGSQPAVEPPQVAPTCVDRFSPRTTFSLRGSLITRRRIAIRGRSRDRGCVDPGTERLRAAGLEKVEISIARFTRGARCQYLQADGRLTRARSCRSRMVYLPVEGTTAWRFIEAARLPRGHYKIWVRGADTADNVERKDARRNFLRVFVR
ncbi:MAG TPA: M14 family zinc carboxypeptidase [Solirubrobacteraceae bacterium]|nr:M14 family zinc carboxypeptidase [Solirubrobacteraceae bacterium]